MGGFFIRQKHGYLDPMRYFGFHEILNPQGVSAAAWSNMHPVGEIPDGHGEEENE